MTERDRESSPLPAIAADNIAAVPGRCAICGLKLPLQDTGRIRITCSPAHKQELYRRRRRRRQGELADAELDA